MNSTNSWRNGAYSNGPRRGLGVQKEVNIQYSIPICKLIESQIGRVLAHGGHSSHRGSYLRPISAKILVFNQVSALFTLYRVSLLVLDRFGELVWVL